MTPPPPAASPTVETSPSTQKVSVSPPSVAVPARLLIATKEVKINTKVEQVGPISDPNTGRLIPDVPKDSWNVGWFDQSVRPGQPGSAFIDGHLNACGDVFCSHLEPRVFGSLGKLRPNIDTVTVVAADGASYVFLVDEVTDVAYDPSKTKIPDDVLSKDGKPQLVLVTCDGTWIGNSYNSRLQVHATLVS